ncbi:MAG: prepilin peptidase [Burkholderiales bacterium]|jgi:leader peptidase (prepilin peptidase)/N-methyltransferase
MLDIFLSPWALGLLGLCVGSFLNVVVHRSPLVLHQEWRSEAAQMLGVAIAGPVMPLSLSHPRSRCPFCGHTLRWYENIPVISFFMLGRKCSSCKTPISWRYPGIELLTALLFGLISWRFGPEPIALLWCGFAALLIALSGIDWDTTLLPDNLTYPLLWSGLLASAAGWTIPLHLSVWGAAAGYLSLWSVYWLFKLLTGQEGMGYGDFKLLAALGAWLGVYMLLPVIMAASAIGALVGIGMKMKRSLREGLYVPFGPFLAGAGITVMLMDSATIIHWLGWR